MLGIKYANTYWFSKETSTHESFYSWNLNKFAFLAEWKTSKTHILMEQIPGAWDHCIKEASSCELSVQSNGFMRKLPYMIKQSNL